MLKIIVEPLDRNDIGNHTVILRVSEKDAPSYFTDIRLNIEIKKIE